MLQTDVEHALDNGQLWGAMRNNRFWRLRRNGATQTWKTRPREFSIPVKAGLRSCARVTDQSWIAVRSEEPDWRDAHFVITKEDPNVK